MPRILTLTLVFCAAVCCGLFSGAAGALAGAAAAGAALIAGNWLVIFTALGITLGALQAENRNNACWRFHDGQQIQFTGVLESLPVTEKIVLRMLAPCEVVVP
ncbi:MAG TPA: hypothetical protein VGC44_04575, partial [Longimicrobiales bacterium]